MEKRFMLISNSISFGKGYLEHCAVDIQDFLGKIVYVLFIPYALKNHDEYAAIAERKFIELGYGFKSLHNQTNKMEAVRKAPCIFVGGGNTFRLLNSLYNEKLIDPIREAINKGASYMGSSAGSNIAAPTIKTTNDMPIVQPPSFNALGLVPFQINPHFVDTDVASKHMGETREQRIKEYFEENNAPVIGLRENSWLTIIGNKVTLLGSTGAKIFIKNRDPIDVKGGDNLSFLQD